MKRVRGLGAAKEGVQHWWQTRLTSIALIPLTLWFICRTVEFSGTNYKDTIAWISNPVDAVLLILFTAIMFLHAASGIQTVLEDYVHGHGRKLVFIYGVKGACLVLGTATVLAILRIALQNG